MTTIPAAQAQEQGAEATSDGDQGAGWALSLDEAIAGVDTLAGAGKKATGPAAAQKKLKKARKKLVSATKKLDKGKSGKSIIKALEKVILPEFQAAEELK